MSFQNNWTFLTNHAHVLLCIAADTELRLKDIADIVGITERAVHRIVTELADSGYLDVQREGRCNAYKIHSDLPMRHSIESHRNVSDLIQMISG